MKNITVKLNSPVKRIGFIILILGVAILIPSLIYMISVRPDRAFDIFFRSIFFETYYWEQARYYPLISIGFYLSIAGLILSFLYDSTIGKLTKWVVGS